MVAAVCPRCASVVALHEGRPFVTASGTVELWHDDCWNDRDVPVVESPPVAIESIAVARGRRPRLPITAGIAGVVVVAIAIGSQAVADSPEAAQVNDVHALDEATSLRAANPSYELVPPEPPPDEPVRDLDDQAVPVDDAGKPIDETFLVLGSWIHPITQAAETIPRNPARHFGAHRTGVDRAECGAGHCGIDLDGPHGRPLVAVADGILINVERREKGGDGRSGRFVRIQHDDGTLTSYMHMDEIDPAFQVGDHVDAGQYIGTLGSTAVEVAHLHFTLEVPLKPGSRGTTFAATRFTDPAPFLVRATVIDTAERRHTVKPAF